jgi:SAM-dependent methyltransferase
MSSSSYEQMPYVTSALRTADPNRLAALARLYGIDIPSPTNASILEIGCGTGVNLLHIAERFPGSRCVGVDISERHVAEGQSIISATGLTNVELRCGDIQTAALGYGEFDYIICHGLYSWVSASVRQQVLHLIASSLSESGVAVVSYNVLPGWRQRGAIRDIMQSGAIASTTIAGESSPEARLKGALEFLDLVGSVRSNGDDPYGRYLRESQDRFKDSHPAYLFHEYLEEYNEPVLFSDFMRTAELHGLQFVSEAKPSLMSTDDLSPKVIEYLARLGGDIVVQEQCLDMIRNRMFRETILCKSDRVLKRDLKASVFKSIHFVSDYREVRTERNQAMFREVGGDRSVSTPNDEHALILKVIGSSGFAGIAFSEICERAKNVCEGPLDERGVMHMLVRLWRSGFIDVALEKAEINHTTAGVARISRLARHQAQREDGMVTALQHRSFAVSREERIVLRACTGDRDFIQLRTDAHREAGCDIEGALERLLELGFFCA